MADQFNHNLTTLARRLRPLLLNAVRAAPGVASVMLNRIIKVPTTLEDPVIYPKNTTGLAQALAASVSGDQVWLPPMNLVYSAFSIPAGVSLVGYSRAKTIINAGITLGAGASLQHLTIDFQNTSSGDLVAVTGPATGEGHIIGCRINGTNLGSGGGYGLLSFGGTLYMESGWLSGSTLPILEIASDPIYPAYSTGTSFTTSPLENSWIKNFGVGGSAPEGWNTFDWDAEAAGWSVPHTMVQGSYSSQPMIDGDDVVFPVWIDEEGPTQHQGDFLAYRYQFLLECDYVFRATLDYWADDEFLSLFINEIEVEDVLFNFWDVEGGAMPHTTIELDKNLFLPNAQNVIAISFRNGSHAEYGTDEGLNYLLKIYTSGSTTVLMNGVRMAQVQGEPVLGDRSVWDAAEFQSRHANDIDLSLTSIHHTLGDGEFQSAPGSHTHAHPSLLSIDTDESTSAIHHTLGTDPFQAAAGDHVHPGFDSNAILVDDNGDIMIDDNGNVIIGDN